LTGSNHGEKPDQGNQRFQVKDRINTHGILIWGRRLNRPFFAEFTSRRLLLTVWEWVHRSRSGLKLLSYHRYYKFTNYITVEWIDWASGRVV